MSAISSVYRSLGTDYRRLSSGKRIQTAADGAAELAISRKLGVASDSYNVGADNIRNGQNLINVADGAMSGVADSLQRMRELALRASNGLMSASDKESIQMEIDQLKQHISSTASNTTFNTKHVLSGTELEYNIAMGGDASKGISGADATLKSLGIADFDVTGDFDLNSIDKALESISAQRSRSGAQYNSLEHAYNYNKSASYNLTASLSRISDLDYAKATTDKKTKEALLKYSIFAQKKKQDNARNMMVNLLA